MLNGLTKNERMNICVNECRIICYRAGLVCGNKTVSYREPLNRFAGRSQVVMKPVILCFLTTHAMVKRYWFGT